MIYAIDDINFIKDYMMQHQQTIAVAESVTSGHLQASLSLAEDASVFYQGGITAYNIIQKYCHLHINPTHAMACNCVSKTVAEEMAVSTCKLFSSTWSLSITGYATPVPGHTANGLFACYAIALKGNIIKSDVITSEEKSSFEVQLHYANTLLNEFVKTLKNLND